MLTTASSELSFVQMGGRESQLEQNDVYSHVDVSREQIESKTFERNSNADYDSDSMGLGCHNFTDLIMNNTLTGNGSYDLIFNVSREQCLRSNVTMPGVTRLQREMMFTDDNLFSVVSYSFLFLIAACGNLTVFITLFRNRHRKSRVNLFIMHLCISDLIVTFIIMPLETIWQITVSWRAGDELCRILMFFRAFGFYLSSFILVCISLDRYFAILKPLSINDADKRGRIMLTFAWVFSFMASIPQSVIFHIEHHPQYTWFEQCVTFNFFPTPAHELAYNLFSLVTVYGIPLLVIIVSYAHILIEVTKKTKEHREQSCCETELKGLRSKERLRRSGMGRIQQARIKTLKMTLVIVFVFIVCWTPYFVMSTWWWFDRESAEKVSPKIQRGLFLFAVSNSCMDPIVYGMFTINFKREFLRCCCLFQNKAIYQETQTHSILSRSDAYRPTGRRDNSTSLSSVNSRSGGVAKPGTTNSHLTETTNPGISKYELNGDSRHNMLGRRRTKRKVIQLQKRENKNISSKNSSAL